MDEGSTRRGVLRGMAAVVATAGAVGEPALARRQVDRGRFVPVRDGFGFRNWSTKDQYFEAPPDPTPAEVRERVRGGWRERARALIGLDTGLLPDLLTETIATQLRLAVVQRAGTNGHCYGMTLTAQRYFERPETIPVDRPTVGEIEHPTVPIEEPTAPVYDAIVDAQAEQFLQFRAWLGRRAMIYPEWIDVGAVLRDVGAVVDSFGTATLTLFDGSIYSHQVLAYGFEEHAEGVRVPIYDPNRPAPTYVDGPPALVFDRVDGTVAMRPYGRYTGVLFNRYDRIERASDREVASPLDHLTVDRQAVRSSLFPLALVLVDSDAVEVTVVDPDGEELERTRGAYMDRSRGTHARVRSLYGADPGTYRIGVFGDDATDYGLRVVVADEDGPVVDWTASNSIDAGELHEYDVEVPEDGRGTVAAASGGWLQSGLVCGAGLAGAAAAGAIGYHVLGSRRRGGPAESPEPR